MPQSQFGQGSVFVNLHGDHFFASHPRRDVFQAALEVPIDLENRP